MKLKKPINMIVLGRFTTPTMAQERDASVVVTVAPVPFVLIQGDDFGIFHILRDAAFTPALAKGVM